MRWTFDPLPRLEALSKRLKAQAKYLRYAMFDLPRGSEERDLIARRLDLIECRVRRLSTIARQFRRNARELVSA
jgi:DNA repair ATPase RecN